MSRGTPDLQPVFAALRTVVRGHRAGFAIVADDATSYTLAAPIALRDRPTTPFASVRTGRGYVSLHLFPVYMAPELLAEMPEPLHRRMHGKSCFNFRRVEDIDAAALDMLLRRCADVLGGRSREPRA